MADFTPDILSQILAGKVAPPAPAPQPAAPIVDPRFGRRAIPIQGQPMDAAIPNPSPNPTPIASGPGVSIPPTQIQSGPGVAVPAAMPTMQPVVNAPNLSVNPDGTPISDARHIIPPDINTQRRVDANKMQAEARPDQKDYRPSFWRTLLGAAAAFGTGYGHNPNAVQIGENVMDAPFNRAVSGWQGRQDQAKNILGEEDKQYGNLAKVYGDTITNSFHRDQLAEREQHGKDITAVRDREATTREENLKLRQEAEANKPGQGDDKTPAGRAKLADQQGLKGLTRSRYILTGKLDKERNANDTIAEDRIEERRTKNLDSVQKDADNAVKAHKAKIQARIDKLDDTDPNYKSKIAQIERDDYAGMNSIGQQFASRSARFGSKFEAPKPEPWEESNLSESERQKLLGGTKSQPKGKSAPEGESQRFPLKESGGHKAGDVVTLKDGSRVKITGFNKNGQFSHVPAGN